MGKIIIPQWGKHPSVLDIYPATPAVDVPCITTVVGGDSPCTPVATPIAGEFGYLPKEVCKLLGFKDRTLTKYREAARVPKPPSHRSDFRFTHAQFIRIAKEAVKSSDSAIKEKCQRVLDMEAARKPQAGARKTKKTEQRRN